MERELRPYQADTLQALRDTLANGVRRVMLAAPTGSGKTLLAAAIANGALAKGKRLAFVVPRIDLIDQTYQEFGREGITEVGVIQASHIATDWSKPIQVCSIQTLKRKADWPAVDVVIIDEAHILHQEHALWMADPDWARVPFVGLSATPFTRGLGKHYETLLQMTTTRELIEQGYLSKFRVFASSHPDLDDVEIQNGEYQNTQLGDAMQKNNLTADIVETWLKRWGKDKTLVFGVNCAHAQALQARFLEAGITCGYQDARTPQGERAEIKRQFHAGELRIVCNVDTLGVGVDWDVRCLSLCRPTRSEMRYVQIIGRALRLGEGKDHAVILDHSDTTSRLGLVTDIHHDELDDGRPKTEREKPEPKVKLPKECVECSFLMPVGTTICPNCGAERKPQNFIVEQNGELVEYTEDGRRVGSRMASDPTPDQKRYVYAQILGYAEETGKSDGWVAHTYRDMFGVWPRGMRGVRAEPCLTKVRNFIRAKAKAYWESKQREAGHVQA